MLPLQERFLYLEYLVQVACPSEIMKVTKLPLSYRKLGVMDTGTNSVLHPIINLNLSPTVYRVELYESATERETVGIATG